MTPIDLSGRQALVTGAFDGLGLAIAEALAAAGSGIVLHGLEPVAQGAARARELGERHGVEAAYVQADLAQAEGAERMVAQARAAARTIDVLVNNAVVRHFAPIEAFPVTAWDRALAVNLSAAFQAVKLLLPAMRERGWGRIVNLSSVYASRGTANRVDYVTTKSALLGLTRAVAVETVGTGITCNAVCPGSIRTPAIERRVGELTAAGATPEQAEAEFLAGKQPTGRFIEAGHVAELVTFLCGPAGRDVTGAMLPVDGGWLAG